MELQEYKVVGHRYGKETEYGGFKSLDAAVSFCAYSIDYNEMFPTKVICPDGREISRHFVIQECMAHGELQSLIEEHIDRQDAEEDRLWDMPS